MRSVKKLIAFTAALLTAAVPTCTLYADNIELEPIPETGDTSIVISPDRERTKISPYIYGINDKGDIRGISPTVIKQTGTAHSTYNWESNYSNPGAAGMNSNDMSLVDRYSSSNWSRPALSTYALHSQSVRNNIPVRLVTLQMMGFAAGDSMGVVSDDELSRNNRWCTVSFNKNDAYLKQPDTTDDMVYIDEYISYLVSTYGTASEGGINGYFLDSEPDLWADNFSVLGIPKITPEELTERSAELASVINTLDPQAFVFGPSLSGLQGCINLNNAEAWNRINDNESEYSWFIDYYLSEMRRRSEEAGTRLLDVLDVHYYTEAITPMGVSVLTGSDDYSRAHRMQAVKTLWDPDYTENSVTVLMNKQFTPIIPSLQASIRINYPGTRLSFSEYDFGGGSDISGAIAQTDALGVFAREEVFLACLSPVSEDYSFQKAAFRLYTDYNGEGDGFGDMLIEADNGGDPMSSVFAASDSGDEGKLRVIVTNKNMLKTKNFTLNIDSDNYEYELTEAYTIDKDSAEIIPAELEMFETSESGAIGFEADTVSVYMLIFDGSETEHAHEDDPTDSTTVSGGVWDTAPSVSETDTNESDQTETTVPSETETSTVTESSTLDPAHETVPDLTESSVTTVTVTESDTESVSVPPQTDITQVSEEESETETSPDDGDPYDDSRAVAAPVKIIVSMLASAVGLGVIYILIFDKK